MNVRNVGMVRRPRPGRRPEEPPLRFENGQVVDAGFATAHQAFLVELPKLVAVTAESLAARVVPLVLEPDRDPIVRHAAENTPLA